MYNDLRYWRPAAIGAVVAVTLAGAACGGRRIETSSPGDVATNTTGTPTMGRLGWCTGRGMLTAGRFAN